jgi:hypothetical protein
MLEKANGTKVLDTKEQGLSVDGDKLLIECCHDVQVTETGIAIDLELHGAVKTVRLEKDDYSPESWKRLVEISIHKLTDLRREAHITALEHHKKFLEMFRGEG